MHCVPKRLGLKPLSASLGRVESGAFVNIDGLFIRLRAPITALAASPRIEPADELKEEVRGIGLERQIPSSSERSFPRFIAAP
jgi:hypothetical protein